MFEPDEHFLGIKEIETIGGKTFSISVCTIIRGGDGRIHYLQTTDGRFFNWGTIVWIRNGRI